MKSPTRQLPCKQGAADRSAQSAGPIYSCMYFLKIAETQLGVMAFSYICVFIVCMVFFDDAKSAALYSAYVDTPQNTRKSTRNYGFLTLFFAVFIILFDDAKSVALYSAYVDTPLKYQKINSELGHCF